MAHLANQRQMTFQGVNLEQLLDFIDERFGDKGCLLLEYKKFGIWNYEKASVKAGPYVSCTIVFYESDKETCDVYLWGTGGGFDLVRDFQRDLRDEVAEEISSYATSELGLKKTFDAAEDEDLNP